MNHSPTIPDEPEQWRAVRGYEGIYEVSTLGRVRSITRTVTNTRGVAQIFNGKLRTCTPGPNGYPLVTLQRDRRAANLLVHRLVLDAFVGPAPPEHESAHWDGDRTNPRLSNLRWATHADNWEDRVRHGTTNRGEACPAAKLTWPKVRQIRAIGYSQTLKATAEQFEVSENNIVAILKGRSWKDDPEAA